jgi:phage shock protein PspC (stress-responsive transcriptional regulator)
MGIEMTETHSAGSEAPRSPNASQWDGAVPPKRLYRHPHGALGGVATGLAGYFDLDPVLVRLLFIVAGISGIGVPAYVVCWVVIPRAKSWPPPGYHGRPAFQNDHQNRALWSGIAIVALAALVGKGLHGVGDLLLPAALVGFGVYLLNQRGAQRAGAAEQVRDAEPDPLDADRAYAPGGGWDDEDAALTRDEPTGLVTPMVLSVLTIGLGVLIALRAADIVHVSIAGVAAGGLVLVGGGLIASLWLGRARGLVPLGLSLSAVMLGASSMSSWFDHRTFTGMTHAASDAVLEPEQALAGKHDFLPESLADLRPEYNLGMGSVMLDLSKLDFTDVSREVKVHLGMGRAVVIVPRDVALEVHGKVGIGKAGVLGRSNEGFGNVVDQSQPGTGTGKLVIDLDVGMGEGKVQRARAP